MGNSKTCKKCNITKPLNAFHKDKQYKDGRHGSCKDCRNTYNTMYKKANKDKYIKSSRKSTAIGTYGISLEEYTKCMSTSDKCEICGSTGRLCYDHDHTTLEFRGVLCKKCNTGIGLLGDTEECVLNALRYLQKERHE